MFILQHTIAQVKRFSSCWRWLNISNEYNNIIIHIYIYIYLVVSTHPKNISQIGSFPQVGVKIKKCLKPPPSNSQMVIHFRIQTKKHIYVDFEKQNNSKMTSTWFFNLRLLVQFTSFFTPDNLFVAFLMLKTADPKPLQGEGELIWPKSCTWKLTAFVTTWPFVGRCW